MKTYLLQNVYEAAQARLKFIFDEFENICVAFSGGKDSGLLLNLVLDYKRRTGDKRKIGVFHQDFECQYDKTTEYVTRMFADNLEDIDPYWMCLPMASRTAVGNFESYWYPWDDKKEDIWVRDMPTMPYVYNLTNNPFKRYKYKMLMEDFSRQFNRWYREKCGGGKTVTLLGLRTDESLQRYSAVVNKKFPYKGVKWTTKNFKEVYSASPLYDWSTEDVWTANGKFNYDYNKLYDLYYRAGLTIDQMRVASPFHEDAKNSLNLYRALDPAMWAKICGRVQGANFAAIYGGTRAMGWRSVRLPKGHTWKSYTQFLLATLPEDLRQGYLDKFKTSAEFWAKTGGGFPDAVIAEIEACGYEIERNGVSNYTKHKDSRIVFKGATPDHTDDVKGTIDLPSWKRMACTILKNDHLCKTMGFGLSKQQMAKRKAILDKYKNI